MFVLRFFAGPIAHRISPLGLLGLCAAVACVGLTWLSYAGAAPMMVFMAATCYGFGKTFFWPTTLGVVSEQFPKGGALTLSSVSAVGLIAVGVLGNPLLGALQDHSLDRNLARENAVVHANIAALPATEQAEVERVRAGNNQATLRKVAVLPAIMFVCYMGLIAWFRSRGGYREVQLQTSPVSPA
jgi:MFS family permease